MRYRRSSEMTWDVTEGRAIILDASGASLITLNPVGTTLWEFLDAPRDSAAMVDHLADRFPEVGREQISTDVDDFVRSLLAEHLLVADDQPS